MSAPAVKKGRIPGFDLDGELLARLDVDLLARAYQFSERAHHKQKRSSGEPVVAHCVAVARILAELHLDSLTVASGLIHDVVEDTAVTVADVVCSSWRIHWRILCRARPVRTCASQSRLGRALGAVMISTVSELLSARDKGAMRPFTFAPCVCSPTSVCTANAKSSGVAPSGSSTTSPVGVRTKISFW